MNAGINFTLNGTTPLHLAAEKGYSDIVQLLIDHGANLSIENAERKTPLEVALDKKVFIRTTEILFNASKPYLGINASKPYLEKSSQGKSTQANLSQVESRRADADLWRDQVQ
jgi:ankyrin repeat protein